MNVLMNAITVSDYSAACSCFHVMTLLLCGIVRFDEEICVLEIRSSSRERIRGQSRLVE
jgi:hypothetical protein